MAAQVKAIAAAAKSAGFTTQEEVVGFALGFAAAQSGAPSSDELKLIYFDGPGRGELIRLTLKSGNYKFTDVRLPMGSPDWPTMKNDPTSTAAKLFGFLPVIEHGDFSLAQSRAIQSYAADVAIPSTRKSVRARAIDTMFLNAYADVQSDLYKCLFGSDESKAAAKKAIDGSIKATMSAIERNIPATGYITGGDRPSVADLAIFDLFGSPFPGVRAVGADLSPYPKFVALAKKVGEYPSVAAYVKERGF